MENQEDRLRRTYIRWDSEKLIYAVTKDWRNYDDKALTLMKEELKQREINIVPSDARVSRGISLKANKVIVEQSSCEICNTKFYFGEEIYKCDNCNKYYDINCWQKNNGCVYCLQIEDKCPHCGKEIKFGALKCKHCGKFFNEEAALASGEKIPLKEASDALTYALIGILCFGIILEPIAFFKGLKAKRMCDENPAYEGRGKAIAAITISSILFGIWFLYILSLIGSR